MFQLPRTLRLRPTLSIPSAILRDSLRVPSRRFSLRSGSAPTNVQHVRFRQPSFFSPRRFATFAIYTACFGGYLYYVSPEIEVAIEEVDELEDEQDEGAMEGSEESEPQEIEDWADEDSTFIPLTWSTKLPRTYYKGSDPEWQAFVQLSKDAGRQKKIYRKCPDHDPGSRNQYS